MTEAITLPMADIDTQLQQDRASRDAARRLLEADLGVLRGDTKDHGLKQRAAAGMSETSRTLAGQAARYAGEHPLAIGGIVTAILLIVFRNTLFDVLIHLLEDEEDDDPALDDRGTDSGSRTERTDEEGRSGRTWRQ